MCLSTPWKGKEQLLGGSKLCIFFLNKLLHLHPSKCWTKATYRITPETTEIVFHWLCLVFLRFFLWGKDEFVQVGGLLGNPKLSLTKRPRAEDHKQNHFMSSVRNRQSTLFRMEEQMSLKLILDTEIKIWFKISVSKIWNRGRKCSFIFPDMFSREKTLSVLSHGLLPVPNVKSSSLYRTTNTTMLVKQNKKEKKKAKPTMLVMATVLEAGVSCDPCLRQELTPVLNWKRACIGWNNATTGREAPWVYTTHLLAHV